MKKILIETPVTIYENQNELPAAYQQAMQAAVEALEDAYAPYSRFLVGAAAILENQAIIKGANQENAAYPMCLCAERTALGAAAMLHPGVNVRMLAITVKNLQMVIEEPAAPCGACRQVICELEGRQKSPITLLLRGEKGAIWELPSGASILPLGFNGSFL
jgi:cytidine deaminase